MSGSCCQRTASLIKRQVGAGMRFKRVLERGSSKPRLAVFDEHNEEWVPVHQLLSASKAVDAELEEALDLESPIPFLGPAAQGLRDKLLSLLSRLQSRKPGAWDVDGGRAVLPFEPQGFRDFSLYMGHMGNASKATIKQNPTYFVQALFMGLGRIARVPDVKADINHAFREVPVHYHGNHLTMLSEGDVVPWPCYTAKLDYELEVAVVICKDIKNATLEQAAGAIGGFCIINDFSARDVQPWEMAETGFGFPKSKNFGTALGPEMVTADEVLPKIFSAKGMHAEVRVNGEVWGSANTSDTSRAHSVEEVVAYASLGEQLRKGEILALGTLPKCCGLEVNRWLRTGDEVTVTVQGIGSVTNTIGAREAYPKDWGRHEPTSFRNLSYRKLREARQAEQDKKDGVSRQKGLFSNASVWFVALLAVVARLVWTNRHYPFEPVLWESPPPLVHLYNPKDLASPEVQAAKETLGSIPINYALAGAEHLFLNELVGPESMAFGPKKELYLSLNDGRVVRVDGSYSNMETVFFTGAVVAEEQRALASGVGTSDLVLKNGAAETELMEWCHTEIQAGRQTPLTETKCGRPLGIRLVAKSKLLYICDAYHGIFTLHVDTMQVKHLVPIDAPSKGVSDEEKGAVRYRDLLFTNTVDIMPNGDLYFTDSSWKFTRAEHAVDIMDGASRGRLLRYDAKLQTVETILCGLHFANGVQLIGKPGKPELLVAESTRFRILKLDLNAMAKSSANATFMAVTECKEDAPLPPFVSIFAEGLPGLPDNIVMIPEDDKGDRSGLLFVGMGTKNVAPFSLLPFLYQRVWFRHLLGVFVPLRMFHTFTPKYGLIAVLNQEGKLVRLYQDPTGRTPFLSEAHVHPETGDLLLGSFRNRFLGRVSKSALEAAPLL